jgi:hypothetical protein
MTIQELRLTSYIYSRFSNYDENYVEISNKVLNLSKRSDADLMLEFLRKWGCRQFKKNNHDISLKSLQNWFRRYSQLLPAFNSSLINLANKRIKLFAILFDDLMNSQASIKVRSKSEIDITFGSVGAAKTLFGIRKHTFAAWDNAIIKELGTSNDGTGYCDYLIIVKEELLKLKEYCKKSQFNVKDLPMILDRPNTSLPKLIDEYYWVTITKGFIPSEITKLVRNGS